ncbi:hypothetical protein CIK04_27510 [Vibrio sp. 03_296]|nr:hypothetical protein CIK04_27510 [Vibrio sp. 03_296]
MIDIALKIFAGIVLLIYLQGKTQKSESKERMCDVYFSILDGQDKLHYHYSKLPFLKYLELLHSLKFQMKLMRFIINQWMTV